jgi:hypothetical protein
MVNYGEPNSENLDDFYAITLLSVIVNFSSAIKANTTRG